MTSLPLHPAPHAVVVTDKSAGRRHLLCAAEHVDLSRRFFRAVDCPIDVEPAASPVPPPARGYRLQGTAEGAVLSAADADACYAGLQTLWQLLTATGGVPTCDISDWPAVATRSFQIDLGRQPETLDELKRLLRQQARVHYNECQLYLENSIKLPAFGEAADPDGLTPDEFVDLQQFGADLGIDVVPSLNLLGHMEKLLRHPRFAPLYETAHGARRPEQTRGGCICPELPESKALVRQVIAEMCALSGSRKLMVGLDECWALGSHPLTRARLDANGGAGPVFRDWICFLHAEVTRHGKQMWMWEDMLFYHHGALGHIPSDIGMCAWHYQHVEHSPCYSFQNWRRLDSLAALRRQGHPVMLCCGPTAHHLQSLMRYAAGETIAGLLVVQWEGRQAVQELHHLERAIAAGVLWSGGTSDLATVARGGLGCDEQAAPLRADWITHWLHRPHAKAGGTHACPRFWSWPENAAALPVLQALATARGWFAPEPEALEVVGLFLDRDLLDLTADVVRETAALAGRQMLQHGLTESPILSDAMRQLAAAVADSARLGQHARAIHDRYTAGRCERPMATGFEQSVTAAAELLRKLQAFAASPTRETWPFASVSLHLDGLVLDACAHHVTVTARAADGEWQPVYDGPARLPATLEGEFVMSFPLHSFPHQVRLTVGGFASLGFMRVRVETLDGTYLAQRVADSGGCCRDVRHLLEFDRKLAVFNEPDVVPKWLSFDPPTDNFVVLEWVPQP